MAKVKELNQESWDEWVATRPPVVQWLCRRLPPDRLYRMKPNRQRVTLVSYSENGTVTVAVSGEFNAVTFERQVFGVNPDDLDECDLPAKDEVTGVLLTDPEDVGAFCKMLRDTGMFKRTDSEDKGSNVEVSRNQQRPQNDE